MSNNLEQQLAEAQEELALTRQRFQDYAYAVSHDLSAPFRHIDGFAQILLKEHGDAFDDKTKQRFEIICEAAQQGKDVLEGLLEYSRLNTAAKTHNSFNLGMPFEGALAMLNSKIQTSGAQIQSPESWPNISGDADQLEQLFYHLLDNALKFQPTESEPRINVNVEKDGTFWRVSIQDNGIGIDENQTEAAFQLFKKLNTPEKGYDGLGMGLHLAQKIIEIHNGSIYITPQASGNGCEIVFTLASK